MRPYGRAPDRWHRETGPRGRRRADLRATGSLRSHRTAYRGDRQSDRALLETQRIGNTLRLAHQLEQLTGLESRVSILGYIQRGGTPSAVDRLLATRGDGTAAVPLDEVAGRRKIVPLDHTWIATARHVGTCLGD
jgi:6-phosphofructokinase 1